MSQVNPSSESFLSKRQRRMLKEMGIDVFTTRTASADTLSASAGDTRPAPSRNPAAAARAALTAAKDAKREETPPAVHAEKEQQAAMPQSDAPAPVPVRIELNFVATPALTYVGETELSALELRFLQDVAGAAHWVTTRSALTGSVRNSEFRWPIVEAAGTPERAVTVFCEKHGLLSRSTAVLVSAGAARLLKPWLSASTEHWLEVDVLAQTLTQGDAKRGLWQRVIGSLEPARQS